MGRVGKGAQYLWVELVEPQSQQRCAWASRLSDWQSKTWLCPLPLLKKEVQQERQSQTAQDSNTKAAFFWDAVYGASRDWQLHLSLIICRTAPSTTRLRYCLNRASDSLEKGDPSQIWLTALRKTASSHHGQAGERYLCCSSWDARPVLPEQNQPVCIVWSPGCLFPLHELIWWGRRR